MKIHRRPNGDIVITNEGIETGIFFRNPFYKRYYEVYSGWGDESGDVYETLGMKSILGFVHRLLNRKKDLIGHKEFIENNDNAAGYSINSIRSPIYFKRKFRYLKLVSETLEIVSKGFNYLDEIVGGNCVKEVTTIKKKIYGNFETVFKGNSKKGDGYNYTYKHIVDEISPEDYI